MAIKQETTDIKWIDETYLIRTYSDANKYIISGETGEKYAEALDPEKFHRTYTESDEEIPVPEPTPEPEEK